MMEQGDKDEAKQSDGLATYILDQSANTATSIPVLFSS